MEIEKHAVSHALTCGKCGFVMGNQALFCAKCGTPAFPGAVPIEDLPTQTEKPSAMGTFFDKLAERSILVFMAIFVVSLAIGTLLFVALNSKSFALAADGATIGWLRAQFGTDGAGDAGGFLQGVWGTAGSLAAAFVAIVLAQQALFLAKKQNKSQEEQDKQNTLLADEQQELLKEQNAMRAQTIERDRSRFEFDLKRDITEQFGPLLQSNLQVGAALNTLFVESVRLHRAVSKQVEKVLFLELAGAIKLIDVEVCSAIAMHFKMNAVDHELTSVKNAMRHLYEALSVANGNPLARLAVKKQLEINGGADGEKTLFDIFSHLLPTQTLGAFAPVDHASFAEHVRVKAFGPTPELRLVESWHQASLFGLMQHSTWLHISPEGMINLRLDEAGEKDGLPTVSTARKRLLSRSEVIGEGLFFLGALIALHTETVQRPEHLGQSDEAEDTVWRVNAGLLALVDFYNAIPSKNALKKAARHIYESAGQDLIPPPGSELSYVDMIDQMIERLPYEHDSPGMRKGKKLAEISSTLPRTLSRIVIELERNIRESGDKFFDLCIGPTSFTTAQNAYTHALSIANLRAIEVALEVHTQASVHYKDFDSYLEQELYARAIDSALLMLTQTVHLLGFYDPATDLARLIDVQTMQLNAARFLADVATNGNVDPANVRKCIEEINKCAHSVHGNERLLPESRRANAQLLLDAAQQIEDALAHA